MSHNALGQFCSVEKVRLICQGCGNEFLAFPSELKRGKKYCSMVCYISDRQAKMLHRTCEVCGKEFLASKVHVEKYGSARFCSWQCRSLGFSGTGNPNYKPGIIRTCLHCSKEFKVDVSKFTQRGAGQYCSRACQWEHKRKQIKRVCVVCGAEFEVPPGILKRGPGRGRFCSNACKIIWTRGSNHQTYNRIMVHCQWCGKEYEVRRYRTEGNYGSKYCSRQCYAEARTGSGSPSWEGGKSFEPYPIEFNGKFKRAIRYRDEYRCAVCRLPGIAVHHINYAKDDTSPDNCITLCKACHGVTNHHRDYWQRILSELLTARLTGANL